MYVLESYMAPLGLGLGGRSVEDRCIVAYTYIYIHICTYMYMHIYLCK